MWFYGLNSQIKYNDMHTPEHKTQVISTVCSTKQQRHTLHHKRYSFVQALRQTLPELEVFGRGIQPVKDKSEALDDFKYHIAVENYIGPHHWTEKLADTFLGVCLPFYAGAPNAADYFPPESFIPIDIHDPAGAAKIIQQAIAENAYEKRLPAILEARKLVMEKYNMFAVLAR
ncbi:MAG: glycosyltransferase family 10 domain-containing protein, partial [Planctomycetota bacterium]